MLNEESRKAGNLFLVYGACVAIAVGAALGKQCVQLSSASDSEADATVADLKKLSGKEFVTAFLNHRQKGHKLGIALCETASNDSKDNDLKAWATKTLLTLRRHLDRISKAVEANI